MHMSRAQSISSILPCMCPIWAPQTVLWSPRLTSSWGHGWCWQADRKTSEVNSENPPCLINMQDILRSRPAPGRARNEFVSIAEAVLRNRGTSWLYPEGKKEQFKGNLKLANKFPHSFWSRSTSLVTHDVYLLCFVHLVASPGVCLCRSLSSAAVFVLKWLWHCSYTDPAPQRQSESGAGVSNASAVSWPMIRPGPTNVAQHDLTVMTHFSK